jgi:hypothetical protein
MPPPGLGFPGSRPRLSHAATTECRGLQEEAKPTEPSSTRNVAPSEGCLSLDPYQRRNVCACRPHRTYPRWGQAGLQPHGDWVPGGSSGSPQGAFLWGNQQCPPADKDCVVGVAETLRYHEFVFASLFEVQRTEPSPLPAGEGSCSLILPATSVRPYCSGTKGLRSGLPPCAQSRPPVASRQGAEPGQREAATPGSRLPKVPLLLLLRRFGW